MSSSLPLKKERGLYDAMGERGLVVGLDEAGRGPLAGPVVAAAVAILPSFFDAPVDGINDSKTVEESDREAAYDALMAASAAGKLIYGVAIVDTTTITKINILHAAMHAMDLALADLLGKLPASSASRDVQALVDGPRLPAHIEASCIEATTGGGGGRASASAGGGAAEVAEGGTRKRKSGKSSATADSEGVDEDASPEGASNSSLSSSSSSSSSLASSSASSAPPPTAAEFASATVPPPSFGKHSITGAEAIIGGDGKVYSIAAASLIAKVTRDRMMRDYAVTYPAYGFEGHKGYGTAAHIAAIKEHGPCAIHRPTFAPIKTLFPTFLEEALDSAFGKGAAAAMAAKKEEEKAAGKAKAASYRKKSKS